MVATGPNTLANLKKVPLCCPVVSLYARGAWTVPVQGGLQFSCVPVLEVLMARAQYVRRALMRRVSQTVATERSPLLS